MNDGMEFNGIPVPKVHRPPSAIFRDDGNPAMGDLNRPGLYKCVDYRIPTHGDLVYLPAEDCVCESRVMWDGFAGSYGPFPRVIVEPIEREPME